MRKLSFFLSVYCLVLLVITSLQAGEMKIAIVDMQKARHLIFLKQERQLKQD